MSYIDTNPPAPGQAIARAITIDPIGIAADAIEYRPRKPITDEFEAEQAVLRALRKAYGSSQSHMGADEFGIYTIGKHSRKAGGFMVNGRARIAVSYAYRDPLTDELHEDELSYGSFVSRFLAED